MYIHMYWSKTVNTALEMSVTISFYLFGPPSTSCVSAVLECCLNSVFMTGVPLGLCLALFEVAQSLPLFLAASLWDECSRNGVSDTYY